MAGPAGSEASAEQDGGHASDPGGAPVQTRLYVGRLPEGVTAADLAARIGRYGRVGDVTLVRHEDGLAKRFAYVDVEATPPAVLKLRATYANTRWKGCAVRVEPAKPAFEDRRQRDLAEAAAIEARTAARRAAQRRPIKRAEEKMRSNSNKAWIVGPGGAPLPILRVRHPATHRVRRTKPAEVLSRHRFLPDDEADDVVPLSALTWELDEDGGAGGAAAAAGARGFGDGSADGDAGVAAAEVNDSFDAVNDDVSLPAGAGALVGGAGGSDRLKAPDDLFSDDDDDVDGGSGARVAGGDAVAAFDVPDDLFTSDDDDLGGAGEAAANDTDGSISDASDREADDAQDEVDRELEKERRAQLALFAALSTKKMDPAPPTGRTVSFCRAAAASRSKSAAAAASAFSSDEEDMTDLAMPGTAGPAAPPAAASAAAVSFGDDDSDEDAVDVGAGAGGAAEASDSGPDDSGDSESVGNDSDGGGPATAGGLISAHADDDDDDDSEDSKDADDGSDSNDDDDDDDGNDSSSSDPNDGSTAPEPSVPPATGDAQPPSDEPTKLGRKRKMRAKAAGVVDQPSASATGGSAAGAVEQNKPTVFINRAFQDSIKHQNGEIPQIGTVTSFSFFGGNEDASGDGDNSEANGDGGGSAAAAPALDNDDDPDDAAKPMFSFFGPAGLLSEQPLAQPPSTAAAVGVAQAAGAAAEPRLFALIDGNSIDDDEDDDVMFCRSGDWADAERAWVEKREEMTEDYKKRRRAAKRRKTKLRL